MSLSLVPWLGFVSCVLCPRRSALVGCLGRMWLVFFHSWLCLYLLYVLCVLVSPRMPLPLPASAFIEALRTMVFIGFH